MQYKVFGCKVNKYYTDRWLNSNYLRDKTGTFVASCVVTDNAKRKWVRFVKKELTQLSEGKIYISWCWAFRDGKAQDDFFILYPELEHGKEKIEILDEAPAEDIGKVSLRQEDKEEMHNEFVEKDSKKTTKLQLGKLQKLKERQIYTKKFILIQWWCDSFCTFCLTVQKRGRHYYRSAEDIAEEIRDFESSWWKEVVLTWVNLSAWGLKNTHDIKNFSPEIQKNNIKGWGSRFAELLHYLLENTSIPRIRISSLGPEFIDDECLKIFENERIYPHFHFSIQSGSTDVLKSMARHYDGEYMYTLLQKLRRIKREDDVEISIWADIIVGFPWESEANFQQTYDLIQDCEITKIHAFPFSAHTKGESVPAWKFKDQIQDSIKTDRMNRLTELTDTIRSDFKKRNIWKVLKVLVEKSNTNSWSGWTENYIEADESNFEIIAWIPKRNNIVVWRLTS